jgi:hypothetical protein
MPRYDYDRRQRSARKAESDAFVFKPITVDDLRHSQEDHTRNLYTAAGHPPHEVEALTSAHMSTVTDEALTLAWQQAGRDIAARKVAEAEKAAQYAADLAAQKAAAKIKRDHQE